MVVDPNDTDHTEFGNLQTAGRSASETHVRHVIAHDISSDECLDMANIRARVHVASGIRQQREC